jgi:DNA excision repair protein ERCC-8
MTSSSSFVDLIAHRDRFATSLNARRRFALRVHAHRVAPLRLAAAPRFSVPLDAAVFAMALDAAESRYLLVAGGTRLLTYDLGLAAAAAVLEPLVSVAAVRAGAHQFAVSALAWYAHDSGLFVSGAFDGAVLAWDANAMTPVARFPLGAEVRRVALSSLATTHSLVAVATDSSHVMLADLVSGKATHTLVGHSRALRTVAWSPANEFLLASAGDSGTVRIWDVRRANACLVCCDDARSAPLSSRPPSPPPVERNASRQSQTSPPSPPSRRSLKRPASAVSTTAASKTANDDASHPSHNGAVNSLVWSHDGVFLLSSGADNRLRLWAAASGANTLVNFPRIRNQVPQGHSMAIGSDDRTVFHPNGKHIGVYNMLTGELLSQLDGHFDTIKGCVVCPYRDELITGGLDRQILSWTPAADAQRAWRSTQAIDAVASLRAIDANRRDEFGVRAEYDGLGNNIVAAQVEDEDDWSSEENA